MNMDLHRSFRLSYLRKSVSICGRSSALLLIILFACFSAIAQRGGKAEPNRIEFRRGSSSTTVTGVVHDGEEAEYVMVAKKGQRLNIKLTSVPVSLRSFKFWVQTMTRWDSSTTRTLVTLAFCQRPVITSSA